MPGDLEEGHWLKVALSRHPDRARAAWPAKRHQNRGRSSTLS